LSRQKKVTQEKATALIPETPETEPAGQAAKNSPRFYLYFEGERGSDTFAADPSGRLDFRRD
jgi:hypothetical protein